MHDLTSMDAGAEQPPRPLRYALYLRAPRIDAASLQPRIDALSAQIKDPPPARVAFVYAEEGPATAERPGLHALLASVRRGDLDLVVVSDVQDRALLAHIVATTAAAGVELVVDGGERHQDVSGAIVAPHEVPNAHPCAIHPLEDAQACAASVAKGST